MPSSKQFSGKALADEIIRLSDRVEAKFRRAFLALIESVTTNTDLIKVLRLIADGNYTQITPQLLGAIDQITIDTTTLRNLSRQAMAGAGRVTAKSVGFEGAFDITNPRAIAYARTMSSDLVTGITRNVRQNLRDIIADAVEGDVNPSEVIRRIKNEVGLTPRDAAAVRNYRKQLIANGKTAQQANSLAQKYTQRLITARAKTIARTEVARSVSAGQHEAWRQMKDQQIIPPTALRIWITQSDEKTCDVCGALDGQTAPIDGVWQLGMDTFSDAHAHPNCRCTSGLVFPNKVKKIDPLGYEMWLLEKGDRPGHEFRGNQWTGGIAGRAEPQYLYGTAPETSFAEGKGGVREGTLGDLYEETDLLPKDSQSVGSLKEHGVVQVTQRMLADKEAVKFIDSLISGASAAQEPTFGTQAASYIKVGKTGTADFGWPPQTATYTILKVKNNQVELELNVGGKIAKARATIRQDNFDHWEFEHLPGSDKSAIDFSVNGHDRDLGYEISRKEIPAAQSDKLLQQMHRWEESHYYQDTGIKALDELVREVESGVHPKTLKALGTFDGSLAQMTKAQARAYVAARFSQAVIDSWAESSASISSLALMRSVSSVFGGAVGTPSTDKSISKPLRIASEKMHTSLKPLYDSLARHTYEMNQEFLRGRGLTEIVLYRGTKQQLPLGEGKMTIGYTRPLSSWSSSVKVAYGFGARTGSLLQMAVPISRVFSTGHLFGGLGCADEGEFVLIGIKKRDTVRVFRSKLTTNRLRFLVRDTPLITKRDALMLDESIEEMDWIRSPEAKAASIMSKGDLPGHPFRGNQWTRASSAASGEEAITKSSEKLTKMLMSGGDQENTARWVEEYTQMGFIELNEDLRKFKGRPSIKTEAISKAMDKGLEKASVTLTKPISVYRGMTFGDGSKRGDVLRSEARDTFKVGAEFTDHAFVSTSTDKGVAHSRSFAPTNLSSGWLGIRFTITVGAGKKVLAGHKKERELILNRGTRMRVVSVQEAPDGSMDVGVEVL